MRSTRNKAFFVRVLFSALAAAILSFAPPTDAAVIDFDQAKIPVSGTLSFDGGGIGVGTVTASAIAFDRIIGHNTPFNNESSLDCTTCTLSFTTGTLASESVVVVPLVGTLGFYVFGPGGSVSLDGEVEADAGGVPPHPGTTGNIVSGEFMSALLTVNLTTGGFNFSSINGITDTKDTALVEYYLGLGSNDPVLIFNGSTTELGGTGAFGAAPVCLDVVDCFSSTGLELADFNNEIPESGTGFLLFLGVSALMARRRRER
jgi:hypothetical protein